MRSRYSAFYTGNADYLAKTHHPDNRSPDERAALEKSIRHTQWLNLMVLKTQKGQRKDKQGTVEFVAAYRDQPIASQAIAGLSATSSGSEIKQLRERSQFVKEGGRWFYTTGEVRSPFIPKRDQPCWCGSGKKFKQCHEKKI